jgi:hypothetical protein
MLFLAGALVIHTAGQPPEVGFDQVRAAVLDARRAIRTAEVRLQGKIDGYRQSSYQASVWFDGAQKRVDYLSTGSPYPNMRVVHCVGCEKRGWGLEYVEKVARLALFKPMANFDPDTLAFLVDPRDFGYVRGRIFSHEGSFEGIFGSYGDHPKEIVSRSESGQRLYELTWRTGPKEAIRTHTAVVAPDMGWTITSFVTKGSNDGKTFDYTVESQPVKWGDFWYPKTITYRYRSGDRVLLSEEVVVLDAKINQPIPDDVFTFKGIGMISGTPIEFPNPRDNGVIRDGRVVPLREDKGATTPQLLPAPPTPVEDPGERRWNPLLLAVCGVLAAAAVFLIVKKLRTGRDGS